jgi:hypothetical protein
MANTTEADKYRHVSGATTAVQAESRKASGNEIGIHETTSTQYHTERSWTPRVVLMTVLVSLGGMIFGYGGIGTIGGFLAMQDYKERFGEQRKDVYFGACGVKVYSC